MPIPRFPQLISLLLVLVVVVCPGAWGGVYFWGDADAITTPDSTVFEPNTNSITIATWIIPNILNVTDNNISSICSKGNANEYEWQISIVDNGTNNNYFGFAIFNTLGQPWLSCGSNGVVNYTTSGILFHIAMVFDKSTTTLYGYVDGVQVCSDNSSTGTLDYGNANIYLGWRQDLSTNFGIVYSGSILDWAFWNTNLTANEISFLAGSRLKRLPLQVRPENLKSYQAFDKYSGNTPWNTTSGAYTDMTGRAFTAIDGNANSFNIAETVLSYSSDE